MDPQFTSELNGPAPRPKRNTKITSKTARRPKKAAAEDWIIWEMEPFSFQTTFVSWTAEAILGYPLNDWLTQPDFWSAHLHVDDHDKVLMAFSNEVNQFYTTGRMESAPAELEFRMIAADGISIGFENYYKVIVDKSDHKLKLSGKMNVLNHYKPGKTPPAKKETIYQELFCSNPDGQIITELSTGQIIEANPAGCQLFGYRETELIGRPIFSLIQPEHFKYVATALGIIKSQGKFQKEVLARPKNGPAFCIELHAASYKIGDKPQVIWTIRDTTQHRQAIEQLQQHTKIPDLMLAALIAISHSLASTLELTPLLNLVFDQFRKVVDYNGVILYRVQDGQLTLLAEKWHPTSQQASEFSSFLAHSMLNKEIIGHRTPLIIGDLHGEIPLAQAMRARMRVWASRNKSIIFTPPCRSLLVIPLLVKGEAIGLLYLLHTEPNYYSKDQLELALVFCDQLAVALEHYRLYRQAHQLATLEERNRLGRELHDSTSQVLSSIMLVTETGRNLLQQDALAHLPRIIDSIFSLAEGGLEEIRTLIFELRPEQLARLGLLAALSGEANALRLRYGLEVVCNLGEKEPELSLELKEGLYRVAREALHNVVKHAGATRVEMSLTQEKALAGAKPMISLQIRDNGRGFETDKVPAGHFGLQTMRERLWRLDGKLEIENVPGNGTLVRATIPL